MELEAYNPSNRSSVEESAVNSPLLPAIIKSIISRASNESANTSPTKSSYTESVIHSGLLLITQLSVSALPTTSDTV